MLHPNIPNCAIVRDMNTFHGVNKCPPIIGHMVCDDIPYQQPNIDSKNEDIGILEMTSTIAEVKYVDLGEFSDQVFHDIKTIATKILALQPHLLSRMKVLRGKQQDMIATWIASLEHPIVDPLFPSTPSDNTFR